jgi:hypothetical protein
MIPRARSRPFAISHSIRHLFVPINQRARICARFATRRGMEESEFNKFARTRVIPGAPSAKRIIYRGKAHHVAHPSHFFAGMRNVSDEFPDRAGRPFPDCRPAGRYFKPFSRFCALRVPQRVRGEGRGGEEREEAGRSCRPTRSAV